VDSIWLQIGNYGFPMVVAIYLLMRVEGKLDALTSAIDQLGEIILASVQKSA
jgi:hypothetical protein